MTKWTPDAGGYWVVKKVETSHQLIDELLKNQKVQVARLNVGLQLSVTEIPNVRCPDDPLSVPAVEEVRTTRICGTHREPRQARLCEEKIEVERLVASGFAMHAVFMTTSGRSSSDQTSTLTAVSAADTDVSKPEHDGAVVLFFQQFFCADDDKCNTDRAGHTAT